jgi:hypothetical protein
LSPFYKTPRFVTSLDLLDHGIETRLFWVPKQSISENTMYGKSIVAGRLKNASEQPSPVCRTVVKNV